MCFLIYKGAVITTGVCGVGVGMSQIPLQIDAVSIAIKCPTSPRSLAEAASDPGGLHLPSLVLGLSPKQQDAQTSPRLLVSGCSSSSCLGCRKDKLEARKLQKQPKSRGPRLCRAYSTLVSGNASLNRVALLFFIFS